MQLLDSPREASGRNEEEEMPLLQRKYTIRSGFRGRGIFLGYQTVVKECTYRYAKKINSYRGSLLYLKVEICQLFPLDTRNEGNIKKHSNHYRRVIELEEATKKNLKQSSLKY